MILAPRLSPKVPLFLVWLWFWISITGRFESVAGAFHCTLVRKLPACVAVLLVDVAVGRKGATGRTLAIYSGEAICHGHSLQISRYGIEGRRKEPDRWKNRALSRSLEINKHYIDH